MTIDLDALEKLAESLVTLDSEERDWPLVKIHGRMFHVENAAKAASEGLTALIAELKEARRLVEQSIDLMTDEYEDTKAHQQQARAFFARNGKVEEPYTPHTPRNAPRGLSDEC